MATPGGCLVRDRPRDETRVGRRHDGNRPGRPSVLVLAVSRPAKFQGADVAVEPRWSARPHHHYDRTDLIGETASPNSRCRISPAASRGATGRWKSSSRTTRL